MFTLELSKTFSRGSTRILNSCSLNVTDLKVYDSSTSEVSHKLAPIINFYLNQAIHRFFLRILRSFNLVEGSHTIHRGFVLTRETIVTILSSPPCNRVSIMHRLTQQQHCEHNRETSSKYETKTHRFKCNRAPVVINVVKEK